MKRSGGKAGRPMGDWPIQRLESHTADAGGEVDELLLILAELGHRRSKRAAELESLVTRLLADSRPKPDSGDAPLFD
jgi:hypothetical protein